MPELFCGHPSLEFHPGTSQGPRAPVISRHAEALAECTKILSFGTEILNSAKDERQMGNRWAFSLEVIHAEVFSRTPKFTSRPEFCPAWDSHPTLRQRPKLRIIDMPSESHVLALGKGPGVAYSIPSSLAISLRTDTLWGPPARVSGLVFPQLLEGHPPLYGVGCGKSGWRERRRTSR